MNRSLTVFTSYPREGRLHDERTVGVAAYTKMLLTALKDSERDLEIEVLGEIHGDGEDYRESGIEVRRIWRRGDVLSAIRALWLALRRPSRTLVVSYEVHMVGGKAANLLFLLLLILFRLKKRVIFLLHQVPATFEGLVQSPIKRIFWNLARDALLRLIARSASKIIVFEEPLARSFPGRKRPVYVPFAAEGIAPLDPGAARERLGLDRGTFYLLFFGYLSPYKGPDLLLDLLEPAGEGFRLILAGDGNPNHLGERGYARYVASVKERAKEKGALAAGFVKEEEIGLYFSSADLVIFPYRIFFSSSYPLSLAFSHERPVLLSRPLGRYFEGRDFREAAARAGISEEDMIFDFTREDLSRKIRSVAGNREPYVLFAKSMKESRSLRNVIPRLFAALEGGKGPAEDP